KAAQDIRQAIDVAPQSAAGYVQLGNLKLVLKQYSEAEKAYQQGLNHDPNSSDALSGLMNTYLAQKQPDKAVAAAQAAIAKSPNNSALYDLLGTALFNAKKDMNGAETALRKSAGLKQPRLRDGTKRRQRGRGSLARADRASRHARFSQRGRHSRLGLLPEGRLQIRHRSFSGGAEVSR